MPRRTSIGTAWNAPSPPAGARSADQMRNTLGRYEQGTPQAKHLAAFQEQARQVFHSRTRPLIADAATLLFTGATGRGSYTAWIYLHQRRRGATELHAVWAIGQGHELDGLVERAEQVRDELRAILTGRPQSEWREATNQAMADQPGPDSGDDI
jgi:hypothetical protein